MPRERYALLLPMRSSTAATVLYLAVGLTTGVLPMLTAAMRQALIDGAAAGGSARQFAVLLGVNLLLAYLSGYGLPLASRLLAVKIRKATVPDIETRLVRKKASMPYEYHESADVKDLFERVGEAHDFSWLLWQSGAAIASTVLGIIGLLLYIGQLGSLASGLFAAVLIPVIVVSVRAGNSYYDTWARTAVFRRRCRDLRDVLTQKQYAQEKLLFGYHKELLERWKKNYETVRTDSVREELKGAKKVTACGVLLCVVILGLLLYMVFALGRGEIGLGLVVSVISIFPSFLNQGIAALSNQINAFTRAMKQAGAFGRIMHLPDEEGAFDMPDKNAAFESIVFDRVSFRYPSSEGWVLRDLSFEIRKGRHYALVGVNGAGKTTLIKLLLRLYRATQGRILIDGKDINDLPRRQVMGLVSALFQDYARYAQTAGENIGIGDVSRMRDDAAIAACARLSGASERIERLEQVYGTYLGNVFEGSVDLSGGEWQKIAIARLLHAKTPLKILDEPTAALDPFSEQEIYRGFQKIMKGTTTLTISHRLASCRYADEILVLNDGRISERGSHAQLMALGGLYAQMFNTQKEMYGK